MMANFNDLEPYRALWKAALHQKLVDATSDHPKQDLEGQRAKKQALQDINGNTRNFRFVCVCAGMDSDFVREAFMGGRIDPALLRAGTDHKAKEATT